MKSLSSGLGLFLVLGRSLAHASTPTAFVSVPFSSPLFVPSGSFASKNHEEKIDSCHKTKRHDHFSSALSVSLQPQSNTLDDTSGGLDHDILSRIADAAASSGDWAQDFDLVSESGASFHALFSGIRSSAALGIKGKPFYLKSEEVMRVISDKGDDGNDSERLGFDGFFTFDDLAKALQEDFLDASRGSTDVRQGWKVSDVCLLFLVCTDVVGFFFVLRCHTTYWHS
jgi:hypothetical protein